MILFMLLLMVMLVLTVVTLTAITIGGSAFIIIFGDVIVCIALLAFIAKKLFKRKKRR